MGEDNSVLIIHLSPVVNT